MQLKSILLTSSLLALSLVAGTQAITEINSVDQFNREVVNSKDIVVVDFYTPPCGPCIQLAPILQRASQQVPSIKVFKVDASKLNALARKYGIRGVPYVAAFNNGQIIDFFQGAAAENIVVNFLRKHAPKQPTQTPSHKH